MLTAAALAQQAEQSSDAGDESPRPQPAAPAEPSTGFVPSEQISPDSVVSFPADI